jgi:glycosyltransferase involved in cell wall biosynthesis
VNILFVESNVDGTIGGSYFSLFFLVNGLDRSRYNPLVVFAAENSLIERFREAGIDTRVQQPRVPITTENRLLRPFARATNFLAAQVQSVQAVLRDARLLRREQIHLLHLNNSIEESHAWTIAAQLLGTPCVVHERAIVDRYSFVTRLLGRRISAVLCVSGAVQDNLARQGLGYLPLITVHNGLDPSTLRITRSVSSIRTEFGLSVTARLLGIVGNLQSWKGQDVVLRAVAMLRAEFPDLVCLLIGDVSRRDPDGTEFYQRLQRLIAEQRLQDCVAFTGYRPDVENYVSALEILVHASIKPEPFGRVLLEGMALRKPIVACRAGGVAEIVVDGETGLLYEPGNSQELATRLRTLLRDDRQRASMGEAGYRRLVDSFGIDKNVAETEQIYRSILCDTP